MSEQTNAELLTEAYDVLSRPIRADHESEEARGVIQRLADAVEDAEKEKAEAWRVASEQTRMERDRAEAAEGRAEQAERHLRAQAVVLFENAKEMGRYRDERDAAEKRSEAMEDTARRVVGQRNQLAAVVEKVRGVGTKTPELIDILDSAPADALREVKAEAWDGGYFRRMDDYPFDPDERDNPYRKEQS